MRVEASPLPEVLVIEPRVFRDSRGFFLETFQQSRYEDIGVTAAFVQDNWSRSSRGTVRGLHFQEPDAQGKLVWVTQGSVFDVAVDVRRGSPRFGQWFGLELTATEPRQLWIPPGFAHGFCVTSDVADFFYKCTAPYTPTSERTVRWDDPAIGIRWPVDEPILSARDLAAPLLKDAAVLPVFASGR